MSFKIVLILVGGGSLAPKNLKTQSYHEITILGLGLLGPLPVGYSSNDVLNFRPT